MKENIKKFEIPCECGIESLKFSKFNDEEEVFVSLWRHANYPIVKDSFFKRMKDSFKYLFTGKIIFYEVIFSKESIKELKDNLNNLYE